MKRGMMPAATPDNPMASSQKYMAYIMPFFALTGLYWPFGLVLYWVTTNVWTLGQQYILGRRYPYTPPTPVDGAAPASVSPAAAGNAAPARPRVDLLQAGESSARREEARRFVQRVGERFAECAVPVLQVERFIVDVHDPLLPAALGALPLLLGLLVVKFLGGNAQRREVVGAGASLRARSRAPAATAASPAASAWRSPAHRLRRVPRAARVKRPPRQPRAVRLADRAGRARRARAWPAWSRCRRPVRRWLSRSR
jgi:hypothetical protein